MMIELPVSEKIWDMAFGFVVKHFPEEKDAITKKFWIENRAPNMQGMIGELTLIEWLDIISPEDYLESRPTFRRTKGIDLIVGNFRVDIKTPSLRVPPKKYHRFLIEAPLVDKRITDIFICSFIVRPEMRTLYLMGYASADDVLAFGELKHKGEMIYGTMAAGYDGYLVASEHLCPPDQLKGIFAGLKVGDPLMA